MKFSSILAFATLALAAPHNNVEKRADATVVGTALSIVTDAQAAFNANAGAITTAANQIRNSITADILVQIRSLIAVDLQNIINALTTAGNALVTVTVGTGAQVGAQITALTQAEINNLVNAVKIAIDVAVRIQALVSVTFTNLRPATETLIYSELNALLAVVQPFAGPLAAYADAVSKASAGANVAVDVLVSATAQLQVVLTNTIQTLGVPA